jgi:malonyl-CoA/methylmalonyl-CoA synthetase
VTAVDVPGTPPASFPTLPAWWAEHWRHHPGAAAIDGGTTAPGDVWTGGRLDEVSSRAATRLAALGLRAADRFVWSAPTSPEAIAALVGALRLGAVVVPVSPSATAAELAHVVEDVHPTVALLDGPRPAPDLADAPGAPAVCDTSLRRLDGTPSPEVATPALDACGPEDPALIVFTSGTTGRPKGAVLTHANLAAGARSLHEAWGITPDDRLVLALPLFHVHGLCAGLMTSLAAQSSVVLVTPFDPAAVAAAAAGATLFYGVPTMYHRLLEQGHAGALRGLRLCVSGSAPLPAALWQRLRDEAGVEILERYGTTETLLTLSNPLDGERRPGTVGLALPGVEARVTGAGGDDRGEGELLVAGPTVFSGYYGRPAATAEAFEGRWFTTGDLASVDSAGYHTIRGRRGDLIISGGHNVYPAEVEDVLLAHPAVAEVAVVGTPSDEWGEAVTAYVVAASTPFPTDAVLAFCAERLSSYKCPRVVRLVDALPRTALGKVQRSALR